MSDQWHYKIGDEVHGPISKQELAGKFHREELTPDTLVKGGDLADWTPIAELQLNEPWLDVRASDTKVPLEEDRMAQETPKSRSWARFIGRMFDYTWFGLILGWILSGFGMPISQAPFGVLLIPFLWVFVEAFFLGLFGTTPGKWMVQTTVKRNDGKKLSFRDALARSFSVWWLGMGAGLPFISVITMIVACVKLSNTGKTSWDKSGSFTVTHKKIGIGRILVLIIFFGSLFFASLPIFYA